MKVWSATGTNCQVYEPSFSVSFITPHVFPFCTSLFASAVGLSPSRDAPPVPTTNSRIPNVGSATAAGDCGAKRS